MSETRQWSWWIWLYLAMSVICGDLQAALVRHPNSTIRLPAEQAVTDYELVPLLAETFPVGVSGFASPRGDTNRLFFLNRLGLVEMVEHSTGRRVTVLDLSQRVVIGTEGGVLGLAFHPQFAANGTFFLFYTLATNAAAGPGLYDRLSRFQMDPADPDRALLSSEVVLIEQFDEDTGHNGGDLHFGPDGYLYVSLGDEGGGGNEFANAYEFTKDFFSAILRIDVDQRPGSLPPNPHPAVHPGTYTVPADNPFIGITHFAFDGKYPYHLTLDPDRVRTEFYAIGFRNPWRMSFDPLTGALYANDVGQGRREEVNLVVKGADYGWPLREGTLDWPSWVPPSGMTDPIFEYAHDGGKSAITGSLFYRGQKYPELDGAYVFSDYGGDIGVIRPGTNGISPVRWIGFAPYSTALGLHPATHEILVAAGDQIYRLVKPARINAAPPARLSETGVFADLATLEPASGVVPYDLNVPFWSDHAIKRRWFSMPATNQFLGFSADGAWRLPSGTVWVKHFDLELRRGDPATARRIETRLIVRMTNGVYGLTYRWDADGKDASLVPAEGADEQILIEEDGLARTQRWRYPARTECLNCHTAAAGHVLGFETAQLNRNGAAGGGENQLAALAHAGYFDATLPSRHLLPRLAAPDDETASREHRVRSYLAANCAQCHRPGGNRALWDARLTTPLSQAGIVNGTAIYRFGGEAMRIVVPGDLKLSAMHERLARLDPLHMPPLATSEVNKGALALLAAWITNDLPKRFTYEAWATNTFIDPASPVAARSADPDNDGLSNEAEFLVQANPLKPARQWQAELLRVGDGWALSFLRRANVGFEVQVSTALSDWQPLDVPENAPRIAAEDSVAVVPLSPSTGTSFFRVRIYEP